MSNAVNLLTYHEIMTTSVFLCNSMQQCHGVFFFSGKKVSCKLGEIEKWWKLGTY